jgi:hypothetical protein
VVLYYFQRFELMAYRKLVSIWELLLDLVTTVALLGTLEKEAVDLQNSSGTFWMLGG